MKRLLARLCALPSLAAHAGPVSPATPRELAANLPAFERLPPP